MYRNKAVFNFVRKSGAICENYAREIPRRYTILPSSSEWHILRFRRLDWRQKPPADGAYIVPFIFSFNIQRYDMLQLFRIPPHAINKSFQKGMKKRIGWEFWQFLGKGFACCT